MSGPVTVFSGLALAIDIIVCFFSLVITGFFAYTISDTFDGSPWYLDLGIAFAVVCFLLLLATSILGCMTCCGKSQVRSLHLTKLGLDAFAWVLTLISAACNTAEPLTSLGTFLDTCNDWYGFNSTCSFGVGVVLLWTNFCLLILSMVLHGFASKCVKNESTTYQSTTNPRETKDEPVTAAVAAV